MRFTTMFIMSLALLGMCHIIQADVLEGVVLCSTGLLTTSMFVTMIGEWWIDRCERRKYTETRTVKMRRYHVSMSIPDLNHKVGGE